MKGQFLRLTTSCSVTENKWDGLSWLLNALFWKVRREESCLYLVQINTSPDTSSVVEKEGRREGGLWMSPCCPPCRIAPTVPSSFCPAEEHLALPVLHCRWHRRLPISAPHTCYLFKNLDYFKYLKMTIYYIPSQWPSSVYIYIIKKCWSHCCTHSLEVLILDSLEVLILDLQ